MFDFIKRCFKYRTLRELIESYKQPGDSVKVERVGDNHIKATVDLGCIPKSAFTSENFERYRKESEREIRERVLENRDSVCYTYLCRNSKLSERFIIELAILSLNEEITEDNYDEKMEELVPIFNENYDNRLDWKNISTYHKLSEEFIEKYKPLLDGKAIGENQVLSEEFIKNNLIVFIHPTTALNFQKHVSKEFRFHLYMVMDNYQDYYQAIIDNNKEYIDSIWNIPYIPKEEDYEG